jgi:hypothetical protein
MMKQELQQKLVVGWKTDRAFKSFHDIVKDLPEISSNSKIATQEIK